MKATSNLTGLAQGILNFANGYDYCECPPVNDTSVWKNSNIDQVYKLDESTLFVQASPNPANTWVAFNYKLPAYTGNTVLRVTDVYGKDIATFSFTAKQGQQLWDTRKIKSGVYFYSLNMNGKTKSGKIVINK